MANQFPRKGLLQLLHATFLSRPWCKAVLDFMFWPAAKRRFGWYLERGQEFTLVYAAKIKSGELKLDHESKEGLGVDRRRAEITLGGFPAAALARRDSLSRMAHDVSQVNMRSSIL